jgi:ketosteroid isomerase-like protein
LFKAAAFPANLVNIAVATSDGAKASQEALPESAFELLSRSTEPSRQKCFLSFLARAISPRFRFFMSQEHAVLAANDAFYRAFEKRDLEVMTAIWSQGTGSLCIHPGRNAIKGWEAIQASWVGIFRNTSYLEIDTEIIRTEVNGNLAYVVLIETVLQVAGGRRAKAQSIATNVFELMAQNWYLVHHHGSPLLG